MEFQNQNNSEKSTQVQEVDTDINVINVINEISDEIADRISEEIVSWNIDRNPDTNLSIFMFEDDIEEIQEYELSPRNLSEDFDEVISEYNININLCSFEKHIDNKEEDQINCPICYEDIKLENKVKLSCGHEYCCDCIICIFDSSSEYVPTCALCREMIKDMNVYSDKIMAKISCETS